MKLLIIPEKSARTRVKRAKKIFGFFCTGNFRQAPPAPVCLADIRRRGGRDIGADVMDDFLNFIRGAELVIHNAPFDVGFIDHELTMLNQQQHHVANICTVMDTLVLARKMHPGQKNNLDALCKRYDIDNSQRDLHGALLDAEILAETFLAMTGGQTTLSLDGQNSQNGGLNNGTFVYEPREVKVDQTKLKIIKATAEELAAHDARLAAINDSSGGSCVWLNKNENIEK